MKAQQKQILVNSLLAYGAFGLVQVAYRIVAGWTRSLRIRRMLKDTPAGHGNEGPMEWLKSMRANFHRIHDWRVDICKGLTVAKNTGFRWSTEGHSVYVNDPNCIRHFLKDEFEKYSKPDATDPFWRYLIQFLGKGIFAAPHGVGSPDGGQSWSRMRKTSAQIFNRKNFNTLMQEVFVSKAEALQKWLESFPENEPVDIQLGFFNFTMDSIMKIFFGEEVDTQAGQQNKYGQAFDVAHGALFLHARAVIMFNMFAGLLLPWPFNGMVKTLHDYLAPQYRTFRRAVRVLDEEADRLVKKCRDDPRLLQRRDLLALFLQTEKENNYSTTFLKEMVLNLVIAGRDTTACALSWIFLELARNPEVQDRLRAEIKEKLPPGAALDMQSLAHNKLPYLHGVLYEALRLWPPVPMDPKKAYADDIFPDGTNIPKGVTVVFAPYILGRDPARYPEPLTFRPERWIPFSAPSPYDFPVFQAGPRRLAQTPLGDRCVAGGRTLWAFWCFERLVGCDSQAFKSAMEVFGSIPRPKIQQS
ncbi:unnamed protein product [Effrenium voratum]|nr:unnamed protein product [Effrenium voratum]